MANVQNHGDRESLLCIGTDAAEVSVGTDCSAAMETTTMTQDELYDAKSITVEPYASGFILADYSGNRGEASYCGVSMEWSKQPIVRDPFPTAEAAIIAGEAA